MANHDMREGTILQIVKGITVSVLVTAALMTVLAGVVVLVGISDGALTALNQVIKVAAIFLGAWAAIGRGGCRGFALGAVTGLCYMAVSYGLYCLLDGQMVPAGALAAEFAMGAGLGALSGAIIANLPASRKSGRSRKTVCA